MTSYLICRLHIYAKLCLFKYYTLQIRFIFCDRTYSLFTFQPKRLDPTPECECPALKIILFAPVTDLNACIPKDILCIRQ